MKPKKKNTDGLRKSANLTKETELEESLKYEIAQEIKKSNKPKS